MNEAQFPKRDVFGMVQSDRAAPGRSTYLYEIVIDSTFVAGVLGGGGASVDNLRGEGCKPRVSRVARTDSGGSGYLEERPDRGGRGPLHRWTIRVPQRSLRPGVCSWLQGSEPHPWPSLSSVPLARCLSPVLVADAPQLGDDSVDNRHGVFGEGPFTERMIGSRILARQSTLTDR